MADRATGWLNVNRHALFRELLLHAAAREQLLCPIYVMMPDHIHLVWIGVSETSDQRPASSFLRTAFEPHIAPACWQHQPHDHVLREDDRERGAFASTCAYLADNPVRKGLVAQADQWPFLGCIVPGYPKLCPTEDGYWDLFWRVQAASIARGHPGKI